MWLWLSPWKDSQAGEKKAPKASANQDDSLPGPLFFLTLIQKKDRGLEEHLFRVEKLAREWIPRLIKLQFLNSQQADWFHAAALFHDLGKIQLHDSILLKPDRLNPTERSEMQNHARWGYELLLTIPGYEPVAQIVRFHHERWDGFGYPAGLADRAIPIESRMLSLIDSYDAMTSDRPYQTARSHETALNEIRRQLGSQFCPVLGRSFLEFMNARRN